MGGGMLGLLIEWLPILLLVAVWILMFLKSRDVYTGKSGKTHGEMLEEHVTELRRQNDLLEKIVRDQEGRIQRLEARRQAATAGPGTSGGSAGGGGR